MMSSFCPYCGLNVDTVPIYEFECRSAGPGSRSWSAPEPSAPCPQCKSSEVQRRYSPIGEGRVPVGLIGKAAAESNARRKDREDRRQAKFAEDRKKRRGG